MITLANLILTITNPQTAALTVPTVILSIAWYVNMCLTDWWKPYSRVSTPPAQVVAPVHIVTSTPIAGYVAAQYQQPTPQFVAPAAPVKY